MATKVKVKPSSEGVLGWAKTEPRKEVVQTGAEPWFRAKRGSVFPARRRLVKKMVFDWLVKSTASAFLACFGFLSSFVNRKPKKATTTVPNANKNIKNDVVFPEP